MHDSIQKATEILQRTPLVLNAMLRDLPRDWLDAREGPGTWSPLEILAHLVHADKANWLPRAKHVLEGPSSEPFEGFDREGGFHEYASRSPGALLDLFQSTRHAALQELHGLEIDEQQLLVTGLHPQLGEVTLSQLISTWVAHDLSHVAQVCRVMARQYDGHVGPWKAFLRILN
ncbi:MAG: hypothetical protein JWP27_1283 [Flaviaesturariibacter sp.]|nr:hypothetical protein [Flaviaesturariibacter sp.]